MEKLTRINKIGEWLFLQTKGAAKFQLSNFNFSVFVLLLTLAACGEQEKLAETHEHAESAMAYTCPMHPQIVEEEPGSCPICGMDLVAVQKGNTDSPEIMLSESQILLANIKIQKAGTGKGDQGTVLSGRITQNENLSEVISSRVPGRIERLHIKETGRQVKMGQPLYDIYSEELLTYQQEYLLALEQYEQLGEEEPRYASFAESARRRLKLYGMTDAQISKLGAGKKSDPRITFLSPAAGVVTEVSAAEGQYVREGERLYSITRLDPLWVEAELYQQDLDRVEEGMEVVVQVEGLSGAVDGKITFVNPAFRSSGQIVTMRVEIPNPGGRLIPGMQANVLLPHSSEGGRKEEVRVPVEAVIRDQEGAHVWIVAGENTFEPRKVITSDATAGQVSVSEGLQPGEMVVTSGAYLLYSEYVLKKGGDPLSNGRAVSGDIPDMAKEKGEDEEVVLKNEEFALAFAHYVQLKNALIASDGQKAGKQAAALQLALQDIPEGKQAAEYAERISGTIDPEEQRQFFFFLNNNFISIAEKQPLVSGKMYVQYCPMANNSQGAYWLSMEEEIRNPYLPENMLSCGEVTDIIK